MDDSILATVKKLLGICDEDTSFDLDIITHLNTIFVVLKQLGVGKDTFILTDNTDTWEDLLGDEPDLNLVKTYVFMRVRKMFDPPTTGAVETAMNDTINELEWRISVTVDP